MRRSLALILTLALAACVTPGGEGRDSDANAVTGDAIATTALPPPPGDAVAAAPAVSPAAGLDAQGADTPSAQTADGVAGPVPAADPVAPDPATADPATAEPATAEPAAADPVAEPEPPRSEAQIRCERRGGSWLKVIPGSEARACVRRTRDSGRRCDDSLDCQGDCLARSGTCAPVEPLFGCQEILDDTGRRMTQCIE